MPKLVTASVVVVAAFCTYLLYDRYRELPWTRDGQVRADVVQDDAFMKMVELMGGDANVESAESGVAKSIKDSVKAVQELGASEPVAAAAGGTSMATGQFREISLRRTSLAQSAPTVPNKQKVSDETVAKKLDDINQTLKDKSPAPAVLG